jgi:hypothetical protein
MTREYAAGSEADRNFSGARIDLRYMDDEAWVSWPVPRGREVLLILAQGRDASDLGTTVRVDLLLDRHEVLSLPEPEYDVASERMSAQLPSWLQPGASLVCALLLGDGRAALGPWKRLDASAPAALEDELSRVTVPETGQSSTAVTDGSDWVTVSAASVPLAKTLAAIQLGLRNTEDLEYAQVAAPAGTTWRNRVTLKARKRS